jgi:hypothetical protein
MNPNRAAWFFVAGVAWLVLRGILGRSVPGMHPAQVAEVGGFWLVIPLVSVVASLTIPLFFIVFLRSHDFTGQRWLLLATRVSVVTSVASSVLVLVSCVGVVGGPGSPAAFAMAAVPWLVEVVPIALVFSLVAFHLAFACQCPCSSKLRRAAAAAAVGAAIPSGLMVVWMVHLRFPEAIPWWPEIARSAVMRMLGLAGAAALVWFLESFALRYGGDEPGSGVGAA